MREAICFHIEARVVAFVEDIVEDGRRVSDWIYGCGRPLLC